MDQLDPRLIEITILSDADRAFVLGNGTYKHAWLSPSGGRDTQREEALRGLIMDCAIVASSAGYDAYPTAALRESMENAALSALNDLNQGRSILNLRITQIGRRRLYRLRDEILQRDRVRDDFGVLWAHRHFEPDLTVKLRFRKPEEPFSLIVLDVDHLKKLNSELGHPGANTVLTGIFEILRDVAQPYEAYRLGGDEAGAILPGVGLDDATKLGEEVRRAVEARQWPGDLSIQTRPTISVGVGTYAKEAAIDAKYLYKVVDAFAETAKKDRNKVHPEVVPAPK
jgi:diguanylate cyclase (GGDEF)-like protein